MENKRNIMMFEFLPNEILIACFEYLNALHIFHSFDQLKYRFNELIRSIPLHVDFNHVSPSTLAEFYKTLSSNQHIKQQIYSLHLSNKDKCNNIGMLLSKFRLDEFFNLQGLTLTDVNTNNMSKLTPALSLLSQLSCFRLIESFHVETKEIISALPMSELRTLTVPLLISGLELTCELSMIIRLTIYQCHSDKLCEILDRASSLKYLTVQILSRDMGSPMKKGLSATNLKRLIIMDFQDKLDNLTMIFRQTPNLKSLTLNASFDKDQIDAHQWKELITNFLLYLNIFKFKFTCFYSKKNKTIEEKFKEFQSDFWCEQHHWYTEYSLSDNSSSIYTIPYISNTFKLEPHTKRHSTEMVNNINTFRNVNHLIIYPRTIAERCEYFFPHVNLLSLEHSTQFNRYADLKIEHIQHLKMIVNLSNIKHLNISNSYQFNKPFILKEILKQTPQLSSLDIYMNGLILLFADDELCKYMIKMITELNITHCSQTVLDRTDDRLNRFCKIFSNLEQLTCEVEEVNSVFVLIKNLRKLSRINLRPATGIFILRINTCIAKLQQTDVKIISEFKFANYGELSIWIIRDMH
jgi:hypothetical protein